MNLTLSPHHCAGMNYCHFGEKTRKKKQTFVDIPIFVNFYHILYLSVQKQFYLPMMLLRCILFSKETKSKNHSTLFKKSVLRNKKENNFEI